MKHFLRTATRTAIRRQPRLIQPALFNYSTKSTIKSFSVSGTAGPNVTTKLTAGNTTFYTDEPRLDNKHLGPNPLQMVLGALCGCAQVATCIVAKEMKFKFESVEWNANGKVDLKGLMGDPNTQPHFSKVELFGKIKTDESEERVNELISKVEQRCPVASLIRNAKGCELITKVEKV